MYPYLHDGMRFCFRLFLFFAHRPPIIADVPQRCQEACHARQHVRCQGCRAGCSTLKPSKMGSVKACRVKVAVGQGVKVLSPDNNDVPSVRKSASQGTDVWSHERFFVGCSSRLSCMRAARRTPHVSLGAWCKH